MIGTRMIGAPGTPHAVALVTIDRPGRRNALDTEHCRLLHEALSGAAGEARVVVVTGEGSAFCAGADLSDTYTPEFRSRLRALLELFGQVAVPVVAAVNGPALGAGTQLAIAADLVVVSPAARFGVPAARLGLAVDHWTVRRLVSRVGDAAARFLLLAGADVDAEAALRCGLAHRAGDVDDALRWAGEIAGLAPLSLRAHKLALERCGGGPNDAEVTAAVRAAWESADFAEGVAAYRERRPPRFSGR